MEERQGGRASSRAGGMPCEMGGRASPRAGGMPCEIPVVGDADPPAPEMGARRGMPCEMGGRASPRTGVYRAKWEGARPRAPWGILQGIPVGGDADPPAPWHVTPNSGGVSCKEYRSSGTPTLPRRGVA